MSVRAFRATEAVQCGDEEFILAIDIKIIDALEDEFDLRFDELMNAVGKMRVGKLSRLLRGLLHEHHPSLSLDEVGGLLFAHGEEFGTGMERLIEKASPETEKAKDENPPTAHRGTGANSSSRGARTTAVRQATSGSKRLAHSS